MIENILITLTYFSFLAFCFKRLMTYMHLLQQDEYDGPRFLSWVMRHFVYDKRLTLVFAILGTISFLTHTYIPHIESIDITLLILSIVSFVYFTQREKDPRQKSKKALVITKRVQRTLVPTFIACILAGFPILLFPISPWFWAFAVQMILPLLLLVNVLIFPFEMSIQRKYWNEAHSKIKTLNPTVIAITGSFGKTSVKHILGHILKMEASTLITPGSVNTPMGITRIIREQLTAQHKYFIVEMGAYGKGSIDRLCRLTPPHMGIITAIGHAHYERFKSLETVAQAKFELAQSILKNNGKIVVHEDTLRFEHTHNIKSSDAKSFIICGKNNNSNVSITTIKQTKTGLAIEIQWKNDSYKFHIPIYGLHHAHNAALAFAMAIELGISKSAITNAFKSMPQIAHRLDVREIDTNIRIIDDAYNSNPVGFRSALELLKTLKDKEGRGILITPGIVELGNAHDDVHRELGLFAAQTCDIAIIVNPQRIPTFIEGFKNNDSTNQIIEVETFQDAQKWIDQNKQEHDVILLENDLPDIYENIPKM